MLDNQKDEVIEKDDEIEFYKIFLVLKKRVWLIFSIVVITVTLALGISFLMPQIYQSAFLVSIPTISIQQKLKPVISPNEISLIIEDLHQTRKDKRFNELAKKLGITEGEAKELVALDARGRPSFAPGDSRSFITITIFVTRPEIINKVNEGILNHLNQNAYVSDRLTREIEQILFSKNEIQTKIDEIEDFKNVLISQLKMDSRKELGFNPMVLERDVIQYKEHLKRIDDKLHFMEKGFEIVVKPYIPNKPTKPDKIKYMVISGIISLFLGVFLAFFLEWNAKRKREA